MECQTDGFRPHFELVHMIGGVNFEAGRDVAGDRGYFPRMRNVHHFGTVNSGLRK